MPSLALQFQSVDIEYRNKKEVHRAVDSFSLDVTEGEFLALLGPNGAGKTSIISATTGIIPYQSGKISVFGLDAGTARAKKLVGLVPQEIVSHGFFSVNEILKFTAGYYGLRPVQNEIDSLLDRLQLLDKKDKPVSMLSGGMKRRLLIAKALLHKPKVLLLDEPSAGVDVELRALLWDFMVELNREGMTIVLTTHYLEEAQRLCKRAAIINHGRLLALDETGSLIRSMSERFVNVTLKEGTPIEGVFPNPNKGIPYATMENNKIRALVVGDLNLKDILDTLRIPIDSVQDLDTEQGDLEHAFLKLIKNEKEYKPGGVYGSA